MSYKMRTLVILLVSVVMSGAVMTVGAQDVTCRSVVAEALEATNKACGDTGRNQACYGNQTLDAEPQPGVSDVLFENIGDIEDVVKIRKLSLSQMNEDVPEWGVALMRLQANLPDTLPGQNVTMLLFGNVEITDASGDAPPPVLLAVTAAQDANVRGGPSTNNPVVSSLAAGQTVTADGRNEAGDWLRIQLDDGGVGWVAAQLVSVDGDVTALPVKDAADTQPVSAAPQYGPMQSFYFKSGVGDAPCSEAPDSGILFQTPKGAGYIEFIINEVNITLGSTGFFQAQAGGALRACTLDGAAWLAAFDTSQLAPAGTCVRVPIDDNLAAAGSPGEPEPYDAAAFAVLPIGSLPQTEVEIAPPLTEEQIAMLDTAPRSGTWTATWGAATMTCEDGYSGPVDLSSSNGARDITFADDGSGAQLIIPGAGVAPVQFRRTGPATYAGLNTPQADFSEWIYWTVINPEYITGYSVINWVMGGVPCTVEQAPFTLTFSGE